MFTPSSLNIALLMMITSAVCWGSWQTPIRVSKAIASNFSTGTMPSAYFSSHWCSLSPWAVQGTILSSFLNNVHAADTSNVVNALIGGALFNLANLLLVAAIDMAGLAVAFPISIGIALVVGTVLSYVLQPRGNAAFLALGVACAFVAVLLDGKAYGSLAAAGRSVSRKSLVTCVVSGILMGLWAPFMTHA